MSQTLQIITTIFGTFLIMLLTSWLLDWEWIAREWPRYSAVVFLMVLELALGAFLFQQVVSKAEKQ